MPHPGEIAPDYDPQDDFHDQIPRYAPTGGGGAYNIYSTMFRVYPFTGLDYWTGILDWNTGLTFESKFNHKN